MSLVIITTRNNNVLAPFALHTLPVCFFPATSIAHVTIAQINPEPHMRAAENKKERNHSAGKQIWRTEKQIGQVVKTMIIEKAQNLKKTNPVTIPPMNVKRIPYFS